jgi:phosphoenolpyruvate synthase/pyruvate phosphate dikinase
MSLLAMSMSVLASSSCGRSRAWAALRAASAAARELLEAIPIPEPLQREIRLAYEQLVGEGTETSVAASE